MNLEGGIFDIDGVVLDTPHEKAWRAAFEELMAGPWKELAPQTSYTPGAFTTAVYQEHVAGKPREAGAAAVLAYFHVPNEDGKRTQEYAEAKQTILERLAAAGDVRVYDDAVRFLLEVKAAGVRVCAASSSKNADGFLRGISVGAFSHKHRLRYPFVNEGTTLLDIFDADVDGHDVPHGKPDPALFLAAAEALRIPPGRCFVVEDAPAGIEAARAGGMYAIGVARHEDAAGLHEAQADIVAPNLDEVPVTAVRSNDRSGAAS